MNISYRKYLTSAYEYYQDRTLEEIEMKMPRTHGTKKHISKVCKGDERMQDIRKTLNELGYERSRMQKKTTQTCKQSGREAAMSALKSRLRK